MNDIKIQDVHGFQWKVRIQEHSLVYVHVYEEKPIYVQSYKQTDKHTIQTQVYRHTGTHTDKNKQETIHPS